jgi:competence protein ComEC
VRLAPVFLAAVALAAGDLTALQRLDPLPVPPFLLVALALVALLLAGPGYRRRLRRTLTGRRESARVAVCIGACLAVGMALGSAAGSASLGSCAAELTSGDSVQATGRPTSPAVIRDAARGSVEALRFVRRGGGLRTRMRDVELNGKRGRCSLPDLTVLIQRVDPGMAGSGSRAVTVRGVWRRYGGGAPVRPRPPDRYGYLRGTAGLAVAREGSGLPVRPAGWLEALRSIAAGRLRDRMPADIRGMAVAMLLAERSEVSPLWSRRFAESGLAHLLAISGLHVGILAAMCTGLFSLAGMVRQRYTLSAMAIAAYVVAIGAPPAAMRAGLIFGLYAIARQRGSPRQFTDMVGAAAVVALLVDPLVLLEPGFQLSFAGFMGVAVGNASGRRLGRLVGEHGPGSRILRGAVRIGAVGTAAFLATAPFAAAHFQRAAPVAIISSWVGTPLIALALPALIGAVALPGPLGTLSADAATALLRVLAAAVGFFARLPVGHGQVAPPRIDHWIAFWLVAVAAGSFAAGRRPGSAAWPAVAALGVWLAGPALIQQPLRDRTLICSVAVGQGDAAVIRTRHGSWIVLDAGPVPGQRSPLMRVLRDYGARGIELLSISHPHSDHMAALPTLFESFRVRRVLDAGRAPGSERYADFLDAVRGEGAEWLPAASGAELQVDEVRLQVLGPAAEPVPVDEPEYAEANESSLSLRIAVRDFVYITTGDAPASEESALIDRWPTDRLRADVLKLGHHGSRTSSSLGWLRAVDPELAVISSGRGNRYGHPHSETLARLDSARIGRVWRTDREGTLCIEIERDGVWSARRAS